MCLNWNEGGQVTDMVDSYYSSLRYLGMIGSFQESNPGRNVTESKYIWENFSEIKKASLI